MTSDFASVQYWHLARKRSTPPLHVIGSKPAPPPFLTIFTSHKHTPLLHLSLPPAAGSSKTKPRVGPHEHEGTKQRTQRNAGTGGQKASTGESVPSGAPGQIDPVLILRIPASELRQSLNARDMNLTELIQYNPALPPS